MHDLLDRFVSLAPNLVTLRVAFWERHKCRLYDLELPRHVMPAQACTSTFLPVLDDAIAGMDRVQRGEGYLIGHNKTFLAAESRTGIGRFVNPIGYEYIVLNDMFKIGVWAYAKTPNVKRLWGTADIVERWPVGEYPP